MIKKLGGKYKLVSHTGKNLGTFGSKKGAEKREKQVNFFKSKGGKGSLKSRGSKKGLK